MLFEDIRARELVKSTLLKMILVVVQQYSIVIFERCSFVFLNFFKYLKVLSFKSEICCLKTNTVIFSYEYKLMLFFTLCETSFSFCEKWNNGVAMTLFRCTSFNNFFNQFSITGFNNTFEYYYNNMIQFQITKMVKI